MICVARYASKVLLANLVSLFLTWGEVTVSGFYIYFVSRAQHSWRFPPPRLLSPQIDLLRWISSRHLVLQCQRCCIEPSGLAFYFSWAGFWFGDCCIWLAHVDGGLLQEPFMCFRSDSHPIGGGSVTLLGSNNAILPNRESCRSHSLHFARPSYPLHRIFTCLYFCRRAISTEQNTTSKDPRRTLLKHINPIYNTKGHKLEAPPFLDWRKS